MDIKKTFEKFKESGSFVRVTSEVPVEGPRKAALNRKGNQLFNDGDVEGARRVFLTTGYSDGLTRVGDHYKKENKPLEALQMYWTAPDHKKAGVLIEQLAGIIQSLVNEENEDDEKNGEFHDYRQD